MRSIRNPETEKIRIQLAKSMIYCLNNMNTVLKDEQLDLMLHELKSIRESLNNEMIDPLTLEEDIKKVEEVEKQLEQLNEK